MFEGLKKCNKSLINLLSFQFHQTLENKKDTIKTLKTELAWAMSKQAEMEYEKTCKEVTLQSQKIEKAENLIQKERSTQRKLESEKAGIEREVQDFAKVSHELENVLDGYKENLRTAKEGRFLYLATVL